MASTTATLTQSNRPLGRRLSTFFYRHPNVTLAVLLAPPLLWLGIVYLGSLFALVIQSFYRLDSFTGKVVHEFTLDTYRDLFTPAHFDIVGRTAGMAAAVTLAAAFPSPPGRSARPAF